MTYSASYNEASLRLRPLITCLKNLSETRAVICHESIDSDRQQSPHLILIVHNPNVHGDACPMARSYEPFGDDSNRSLPTRYLNGVPRYVFTQQSDNAGQYSKMMCRQ